MSCFIILLSFVAISEASLKLIFSDEFNGNNSIDHNKWKVTNEQGHCDGNFNDQLHCKVNTTRNLRLIDGTLVCVAIREQHLDKEFTATSFKTWRSFRYGRFEIRGALPEGKMLRPSIFLLPTEKLNNESKGWAKDGLIEIMSNNQKQEFYYGVHYALGENRHNPGTFTDKSLFTNSLFNFHIYAMEWTETGIRWFFDDKLLAIKFNTTETFGNHYNPFDKLFRLVISFGVGGQLYFGNQNLSEQDVENWPCSLFILDYVRVYEINDDKNDTSGDDLQYNQIRSSQICYKVMPTLRKGYKESTIDLMAIISISSFVLLLVLIPLIVFLLIRQKNLRKKSEFSQKESNGKEDLELYDEVIDQKYSNTYETYEFINDNDYTFIEEFPTNHNYLAITNESV